MNAVRSQLTPRKRRQAGTSHPTHRGSISDIPEPHAYQKKGRLFPVAPFLLSASVLRAGAAARRADGVGTSQAAAANTATGAVTFLKLRGPRSASVSPVC